MMSEDTPSVTTSQALRDGQGPSNSQEFQQADLFGPPPYPVNHSPTRGKGKAKKTRGTSGRCSFGSSASACLQSSVASKLLQMTDTDGSPEYALTWKRRALQSGAPICRLQARALRTSDTDSSGELSGYPTPEAGNFGAVDLERMLDRRAKYQEKYGNNGFGLTLGQMVPLLFGWATCTVGDSKSARNETANRLTIPPTGIHAGQTLVDQVTGLAGWATAAARDAKGANTLPRAVRSPGKPEDQLANQAAHLLAFEPGTDSESSSVGTASPGVSLNPYFSAWLMGYSPAWLDCRPEPATRSRGSSPAEVER